MCEVSAIRLARHRHHRLNVLRDRARRNDDRAAEAVADECDILHAFFHKELDPASVSRVQSTNSFGCR